jgi:hypothetical protein
VAGACITIYRFELYVITLGMHYVEYHVLMVPRIASRPAGAEQAGWSPVRKVAVAYALALAAAIFFYIQDWVPEPASHSQLVWAAANLFSGVFLAHYFLERMVWRFSDPFYGSALGPIYFPGRQRAAA